jgi:DNA-binding response OmpR family regulator
VHPFGRASDALRVLTVERPDLVILDLGLPDIDGTEALRMIRAVSDVPVIIATARRAERDIITLLHAGADDYVTKPFSAAQLLARISAVLRRNRPQSIEELAPPIVVGALSISLDQHQATLDGRLLQLTRREFELLAYLAERVDRVVTRRELMTEVWRQPQFGEEQTIDVHISWLRRKLGETAARPRFLRTVRGVGVMMVSQP